MRTWRSTRSSRTSSNKSEYNTHFLLDLYYKSVLLANSWKLFEHVWSSSQRRPWHASSSQRDPVYAECRLRLLPSFPEGLKGVVNRADSLGTKADLTDARTKVEEQFCPREVLQQRPICPAGVRAAGQSGLRQESGAEDCGRRDRRSKLSSGDSCFNLKARADSQRLACLESAHQGGPVTLIKAAAKKSIRREYIFEIHLIVVPLTFTYFSSVISDILISIWLVFGAFSKLSLLLFV